MGISQVEVSIAARRRDKCVQGAHTEEGMVLGSRLPCEMGGGMGVCVA